jgi:uncharacterized protein involved in exopolysaccharide biosynthesis
MPEELARYSQILRRRLHVIVVVCIIGAVIAPFLPRVIHQTYLATARLLVVSEVAKDTTLTSTDLPSIAQSSAVLERVQRRLNLGPEVDLSENVRAKVLPRSSIMQVTYGDRDSERAALIANAVADETVVYYREIAVARYGDVTRLMSQKIEQLRAQIDTANRRLQRASAGNPYVNSDKAGENLTARVDALRTARDQAQADLVADRAKHSALAAQGPKIEGIVQQEVLARDPVYTNVQAQLAEDEAALAEKRATYTNENPVVIALSEKVDLERTHLRTVEAAALRSRFGTSPSYASNLLEERKAAGTVAGDEARVAALNAELAEAEGHLRDTFGPGAAVGVLRAERDAAQQQYLSLTQRLSSAQADAAQAASLGTLVVVDRAVAGKAKWEMLFAYFPLVYALLVCVLALAAAYVAESTDRRFRDAGDLEDFYGRPAFEIGEL